MGYIDFTANDNHTTGQTAGSREILPLLEGLSTKGPRRVVDEVGRR
jgi:hypothetical protein